MYKLRQTWNDIFSSYILYDIDISIKHIDPAWPITADTSSSPASNPISITSGNVRPVSSQTTVTSSTSSIITTPSNGSVTSSINNSMSKLANNNYNNNSNSTNISLATTSTLLPLIKQVVISMFNCFDFLLSSFGSSFFLLSLILFSA
jgi:hypothetical protein